MDIDYKILGESDSGYLILEDRKYHTTCDYVHIRINDTKEFIIHFPKKNIMRITMSDKVIIGDGWSNRHELEIESK